MKKKIFISLILVLAMFLLIGLTTKVKAATDVNSFLDEIKVWVEDPTGIELDTLRENTIILKNDVKLGNRLSITDGKIILDLNGHIIDAKDTSTIFSIEGENTEFTVLDSSQSKAGGIKTEGAEMFFMESGKLTIEDGTYSADYNIIRARGGKIVINGGKFETIGHTLRLHSTYGELFAPYGDDREFTVDLETEINGGTFNTNNSPVVDMAGGSLTINNGNFTANLVREDDNQIPAITISNIMNIGTNNKVIINGGNVESKYGQAISFSMNEDSKSIPVTINRGTFKSNGYEAITKDDDVELTIKGGKFLGEDVAIKLTNNTTIEGGEFIGNPTNPNSAGASYESGKVLIKGGVFKGSMTGLGISSLGTETDLRLQGGSFSATGEENGLGGVLVLQGFKEYYNGKEHDDIDTSLNVKMILAEGYKYDNSETSQKKIREEHENKEYEEIYFDATALAVKVVPKTAEDEKAEDENTDKIINEEKDESPDMGVLEIKNIAIMSIGLLAIVGLLYVRKNYAK